MRQVWITGTDRAETRTVAPPTPLDGEVIIDVAYAGICGSDVHTLRVGHPWLPYPLAPGHEGSGLVTAVGPGVSTFPVGSRIYVNPVIACGRCSSCHVGRTNLCQQMVAVGSHRPGLMADQVAVPAVALRPVPGGMSLQAAALIEPFATAAHALGVAQVRSDRAALVIGGGTIGQTVLLALLDSGLEVCIIDPVEIKRELALRHGASSAWPSTAPLHDRHPARRFDYVFDCVATPATLHDAVQLASVGGRVVAVGVADGTITVDVHALQDQELTLAGSAMYVEEDFALAERLAGQPTAAELVTSVRGLGDAVPTLLSRQHHRTEVKTLLTGPAAHPDHRVRDTLANPTEKNR